MQDKGKKRGVKPRTLYNFGDNFRKDSQLTYLFDTDDKIDNRGKILRQSLFLCTCGKMFVTVPDTVKRGKRKSCGCARNKPRKHGGSKHDLYPIWRSMINRCYDPKDSSYSNYGGRGIGVCGEWLHETEGFSKFVEDMGDRRENLSLERKDTGGWYTPENCTWSSYGVQSFNQRTSKANRSGKTGVHYSTKDRSWVATIGYNKEKIYLGSYKDFEDAVKARKEAEINYYGFELNY